MEQDYEQDCCITRNNDWFRYRAAAIIVEENCVLLAGNEVVDYYYSVGGGVHMGETAEEAVKREVLEETGVPYEIDRLVFVHENFFHGDGVIEGMRCHEIAFYFLMKPRGTQELKSNSVCSEGKEYMYWIPIPELKNIKAFPSFLEEKINNLPEYVEHIVTDER